MKHRTARRTVLTVLLSAALAVLAIAPTVARASLSGRNVTLYVVEKCSVCGGSHYGWDVERVPLDLGAVADGSSGYQNLTYKSSNEKVATGRRPVLNPEYGAEIVAQGAGKATITIHADNVASDVVYNVTVEKVSDVSKLGAEDRAAMGHAPLTSVEIVGGDRTYAGISYAQMAVQSQQVDIKVNDGADVTLTAKIDDTSVATVNGPISKWDTPSAGSTHYLSVLPGYLGGTTKLTVTATDKNDPRNVKSDSITIKVTPGEGWIPVRDFELGENGVVTLPMGWAALGGHDITGPGFLEGDSWDEGPRADVSTSIADTSVARLAHPESSWPTIIPLKPGTTTVTVKVTDLLFGGTITKTAKLVVSSGKAVTTITNDQGATLSHDAKLVHDAQSNTTYSDDNVWRNLTLQTKTLSGSAASGAIKSVESKVGGSDALYVYDIKLLQGAAGDVEFEIPKGESVTVTLPVPQGTSTDGLRVFHVDAKGNVTDMNATVNAGKRTVSFTTTHFSTFVLARTSAQTKTMYRLYNRWTGEHLYTSDANEQKTLVRIGWNDEGVGWIAPTSGDKVYRLYNPYVKGGDHHYTMDANEYAALQKVGWRAEGVGWYSAKKDGGVPLYRQYNPFAETGTHNYTADKNENDTLVKLGWRAEGVAWYGVKTTK